MIYSQHLPKHAEDVLDVRSAGTRSKGVGQCDFQAQYPEAYHGVPLSCFE